MNPVLKPKLRGGIAAIILTASSLALFGCSDNGDSGDSGSSSFQAEHGVVVATRAADGDSGAHAIIDTDNPDNKRLDINPAGSDLIVRGYGEHFFRFNRTTGTVAKFSSNEPGEVLWDYALGDDSNPHDLVVTSDHKAYVLQYGKNYAYQVDPSAAQSGQFPTEAKAIDLGHYAVAGTPPNMTAGVVVDGRLYIVMQRLDNTWTPSNAYVAVIDVDDNTEIKTNAGSDDLKGIELETKNPQELVYDEANGQLLVASVGDYSDEKKKSGGVERIKIDCSTDDCAYTTSTLIDDGTDHSHRSSAIAVARDDLAYLVSYAGYGDNSLVAFNPKNGTFVADADDGEPKVIGGLSGTNIPSIAIGPEGNLWVAVGDAGNPGLTVIDPTDHSTIHARIGTNLNPHDITFTTQRVQ